MKMINLQIKINSLQGTPVTIEIPIMNKYTILKGDTSSGKSLSIDILRFTSVDTPGYSITSFYSEQLRIVDDVAKDLGNIKNGDLVIIDEYAPILTKPKLIQKTDAYFLIITRKSLDFLRVHCNSVFYLDDTDPYHLQAKAAYTQLKKLTHPLKSYDYLITEDAKSSYLFFNQLSSYINNYINIKPARGKSRIANTIHKLHKRNNSLTFLVVYDAAAFGFQFESLYDYIQEHSIRCNIIDWDSFEYYLYNCFFTPKQAINSEPYKYESIETLYEDILIQDKQPPKYNKSDLMCYSLKEGCNTCKEDCKYRHSNSQLYHFDLIKAFGYENLSKLI